MDEYAPLYHVRSDAPPMLLITGNRAKGSVWYSKINNEIEFFTADGGHPVVISRRLKPVSDYIINKYAHPAMSLKQ